jgi:hypothetical protein
MSSVSTLDNNIHRAIDLTQVLVLRMEAMKRLNFDDEVNEELSRLIKYTIDCANLLHQARKDTQRIPFNELQI